MVVLLNSPTLTEVFVSSSEALLPPTLLTMLIRLAVRGCRIALDGRGGMPEGDVGGELAMALLVLISATKTEGGSVEAKRDRGVDVDV